MKMELKQHKKEFLTNCGFEQTYKSEPITSMGVLVNMEVWDKFEELVHYKLYIHFVEKENAYCNLYTGENDHPEVFSERNLISELKKRGF